jgi:hypothetical protein
MPQRASCRVNAYNLFGASKVGGWSLRKKYPRRGIARKKYPRRSAIHICERILAPNAHTPRKIKKYGDEKYAV